MSRSYIDFDNLAKSETAIGVICHGQFTMKINNGRNFPRCHERIRQSIEPRHNIQDINYGLSKEYLSFSW